jgi:gamma-glutamyltranspeptidase/glutathione hydrolase
MVATSIPLATQVGVDILQAGGSAVDAAIAANAALGLMEPTGNGIGGDIFAIVWDAKTKKLHGLNGSGRSPLGLSYDWHESRAREAQSRDDPTARMLPISVPGCVDGWFELHKKFGKLPMKQVLQPAINYANEGFPVSDIVAYYMDRASRLSVNSPARFSRRSRSTAARPREARSSRTRRSRKHCRS